MLDPALVELIRLTPVSANVVEAAESTYQSRPTVVIEVGII
jgi:hypothetical protein